MNKDNLTDIVVLTCPDCNQSWEVPLKHEKMLILPCDCKVHVHMGFPKCAESVQLSYYRPVEKKYDKK